MHKPGQLKTAAIEKSSHHEYFNIAVSVDCVIFGYDEKKNKNCCSIKSDLKEFEDLYSLLGDLVRPDEDMAEAPYACGCRNVPVCMMFSLSRFILLVILEGILPAV